MGSLLLDDRLIAFREAKRQGTRSVPILFPGRAKSSLPFFISPPLHEFRYILGTQYEREAFAVVENLR